MSSQLNLPFVERQEPADPGFPATPSAPSAPSPLAAPADSPEERIAHLQRRVHEATAEWIGEARARWPGVLFRFPRIAFRLRGRAAGEACGESWTTNYNLQLLDRYGEEFVAEIVPHEVAHLVVAAIHPTRVKPHGPEWRQVMQVFGVRARVTHGFETTPARRVGRVPYRCGCDRSHLLTIRAHRKIRRGSREYVCRSCREVLRFAGKGRSPSSSPSPGDSSQRGPILPQG